MAIDPALDKLMRERLMMLNIVCAKFLATVIILSALPYLGVSAQISELAKHGSLLAAVSVALLLIGSWVKRVLYRPTQRMEPEQNLKAALDSYFVAHIVSYAVLELAAIIAFMIYLCGIFMYTAEDVKYIDAGYRGASR